MNELLNVVLDFNAEVIGHLDLEVFIGSVLKFLNCFRMQSGLNQSRIYIAFSSNSYLIYPLENFQEQIGKPSKSKKSNGESGQGPPDLTDQSKMHTLSFDQVKMCLLDRILKILDSE